MLNALTSLRGRLHEPDWFGLPTEEKFSPVLYEASQPSLDSIQNVTCGEKKKEKPFSNKKSSKLFFRKTILKIHHFTL